MNQSNKITKSNFFTTQRLVIISLLCAVAYISSIVIRVPFGSFLSYDPKDIIIVVSGFIFSPIYSLLISVIVSLVEMVTVSDSGPIGMLMNVLASCIFSLISTFFYKKNNSHKSVITGLVVATISMTGFMMLWNYIITPFYLGVSRDAVVDMLVPIILPFNLVKAVLNSSIILIIYKPIISALLKNKIITSKNDDTNKTINFNILIISTLLIISCILVILIFNGVI